jgi:signal transduction histidine kinase
VIAQDDTGRDATEIIELNSVTFQAKAARAMEGDALIGSVVVLRDISRLQELDHLKDRFISTVSHELRTPLANLKLYLQLLEKGPADRHTAYLDVMRREALRLERLIDDLLQISRLQSEQHAQRRTVRAPIDLERLVALVVEHNSAWAENDGKTLAFHPAAEGLPPITGDSDQIERALTNLISNAIRYTPEGGQITVCSRLATGHDDQDWVIIEVTDTGIGIPADEQPMIFDRFFRASNVSPTVPGTGLGLAILRDIIELHGGKVEVESQEHQGSTFRLWLPVLDS